MGLAGERTRNWDDSLQSVGVALGRKEVSTVLCPPCGLHLEMDTCEVHIALFLYLSEKFKKITDSHDNHLTPRVPAGPNALFSTPLRPSRVFTLKTRRELLSRLLSGV